MQTNVDPPHTRLSSPLASTKSFQKAPRAQTNLTQQAGNPEDSRTHAIDIFKEHLIEYPELRFADKSNHWYTDGSKLSNGVISGSVVHPAQDKHVYLQMTGHDPQLNTAVRAELGALSHAIATAEPTHQHQEVTIFTDCLTAMYNIMSMLETPQKFVGHKHDRLLRQTVQTLRCATHAGRRITIRKVRAHAGVVGNEMADTIAKNPKGADPVQFEEEESPLDMKRRMLLIPTMNPRTRLAVFHIGVLLKISMMN